MLTPELLDQSINLVLHGPDLISLPQLLCKSVQEKVAGMYSSLSLKPRDRNLEDRRQNKVASASLLLISAIKILEIEALNLDRTIRRCIKDQKEAQVWRLD